MKSRATGRNRRFTLVEMMVVIRMILILLSLAMPLYSHSVTRAREENLRHNLETLNQMIFQYTLDKQKAPQGLEDLMQATYLDRIPEDITGTVDTWVPEPADCAILPLNQTDAIRISCCHSASNPVCRTHPPD